jgi:hypothetical protein
MTALLDAIIGTDLGKCLVKLRCQTSERGGLFYGHVLESSEAVSVNDLIDEMLMYGVDFVGRDQFFGSPALNSVETSIEAVSRLSVPSFEDSDSESTSEAP